MRRIFYDLETTGLDILTSNVLQCAILDTDDNGIIRGYDLMFWNDAYGEVPEGASKVNGLTTEIMKPYGEKFKENLQTLYALMTGANTIGYNNIKYDEPLLKNWFLSYGQLALEFEAENDVMRMWMPHNGGKRTKLVTLTKTLGISEDEINAKCAQYFNKTAQAHDATYDTMATYLCYLKIMEKERSIAAENPSSGSDSSLYDISITDYMDMNIAPKPTVPYVKCGEFYYKLEQGSAYNPKIIIPSDGYEVNATVKPIIGKLYKIEVDGVTWNVNISESNYSMRRSS